MLKYAGSCYFKRLELKLIFKEPFLEAKRGKISKLFKE
jgi:hypothetical protein